MNNQITDKTMVAVTRAGDFWITKSQANNLMKAKDDRPTGFTELDDCMVTFASIDSILTAEKYQEYNFKRRGGWQCKYQAWHERGQQCAHGQMR